MAMNQTRIDTKADNGRPKPVDGLVPMDFFIPHFPVNIDLICARARHRNNFLGEDVYADEAKLWLHSDLAKIVLCAARLARQERGWSLELTDGLRPVEAQAHMQASEIVIANPHWADGLLSLPGEGGHPRGMAVDLKPVRHDNGLDIDMGTEIDDLPSTPDDNPSARAYRNFDAQILDNRQALEDIMMRAAADCHLELLPLPAEWWDFRFPKTVVEAVAPLSEADLPAYMHVTKTPEASLPDELLTRCRKLGQEVDALCPL